MDVLKAEQHVIIYDIDGLSLLRALPDQCVPVIASGDSRIQLDEVQEETHRVLIAGGFLFARQQMMSRVNPQFDVWHRHGSTILGKSSKRPFFHAVTCTEDDCDPGCTVFGLTTDRDLSIALSCFPKGTMVDPFGGKDEFVWRQARENGYSCLAGI